MYNPNPLTSPILTLTLTLTPTLEEHERGFDEECEEEEQPGSHFEPSCLIKRGNPPPPTPTLVYTLTLTLTLPQP